MRARMPLIVGFLVALLVTVAFFFLLWQPRSEEQAELEDEIATLQARQVQLNNEIRQLEEVQANELQIRAALARLEEFIPTGTAQPTVIRQFQLSADAAGVEITSVTFGAPVVVDQAPPTGDPTLGLASIPVTMVTEGGYFQQVDLFRRLEVDVTRAVLVNSVAMSAGGDGFPVLATTWAGRLYALVPVDAPPPPEDEVEDGNGVGAEPEEAA
jgi:Tfp pilus assembly protein PilO